LKKDPLFDVPIDDPPILVQKEIAHKR